MDLLLAAVLADAAPSPPVFTAAHFLSGNAQHDDSVAFCNFKPELSEPVVAVASSGTSASPLLCARKNIRSHFATHSCIATLHVLTSLHGQSKWCAFVRRR